MSDSLPKPLSSINALRAHLRLLERGVNDARSKRVGPEVAKPAPAPTTNSVAAVSTTAVRTQPTTAPYSISIPKPTAPRSETGADGKPRARAKQGTDFSSFFGDVQKRAAS